MRKYIGLFLAGIAVAAAGVAAWRGGGYLWTKFLELHGIHRPAAAKPGTTAADWPATRAGAIARGWVEAYDSGIEAMRKFRAENFSPTVLPNRTEEERDASYRELRGRFGDLKLSSVVSSDAGELEVVLTATDGSPQNFTFEIETESPGKLLAVKMREAHHFP